VICAAAKVVEDLRPFQGHGAAIFLEDTVVRVMLAVELEMVVHLRPFQGHGAAIFLEDTVVRVMLAVDEEMVVHLRPFQGHGAAIFLEDTVVRVMLAVDEEMVVHLRPFQGHGAAIFLEDTVVRVMLAVDAEMVGQVVDSPHPCAELNDSLRRYRRTRSKSLGGQVRRCNDLRRRGRCLEFTRGGIFFGGRYGMVVAVHAARLEVWNDIVEGPNSTQPLE
jgi:Arc/MetJ family transcription regulator